MPTIHQSYLGSAACGEYFRSYLLENCKDYNNKHEKVHKRIQFYRYAQRTNEHVIKPINCGWTESCMKNVGRNFDAHHNPNHS